MKTQTLQKKNSLDKNIRTDVLVIGAGLAGILSAYMLKEKGIDCVVVERNRIMGGESGNTTAKITAQHGLIYSKLLSDLGTEKAKLYLKTNNDAVNRYEKLCRKIDCDFEKKDNFVYSINNRRKLQSELDALDKLGFSAEFQKELPLPMTVAGAVKFSNQAQFHPVKFASEIIRDLDIYENTPVKEISDSAVITPQGTIKADYIIVATHFPFINNHGAYFMKLYQHRSYVIALQNAKDYDGMYVDEKDTGMSFRNYKDFLLVGGGDHRTGKNGGNWRELRDFSKINYPGAAEKYFWAAQDCMSLDGVPYIGKYHKGSSKIYVATGFNKWGMTGSLVAAELLTNLVSSVKDEREELFSPSRSILKPQLFLNGIESVISFITPAKKRCPHLGCALRWNSAEHSWDCPCHGSRFDENGKLLDNPANGDLP